MARGSRVTGGMTHSNRRHDDGKGRHEDGKRQQGDRRHGDGDGQHDVGDGRQDDCFAPTFDVREDPGEVSTGGRYVVILFTSYMVDRLVAVIDGAGGEGGWAAQRQNVVVHSPVGAGQQAQPRQGDGNGGSRVYPKHSF